jgi:hypothetical protein
MTTIDLNELGQRLRELPINQPDPGEVAHRVLAKRPAIRQHRFLSVPAMMRPLAAVVVVLLVGWGIFYFSPAAGAALADAPGIGPVSSFVLQSAGLGTGSSLTAENAMASQSGITVRLLGVSADPIRTVLLLNVSPASDTLLSATLTDQFGASYDERGGTGDLRTGDFADSFAPPSGIAAALGMRFTLTLSGFDTAQSIIQGAWTIHGIALARPGVTFAAPPAASVGQATITFSSGQVGDHVLDMTAHLRGVTAEQLGLSQKQKPGEEPPLKVEVIDSAGKELPVPYELTGEDGGLAIDVIAYGLSDHGTYTLRISIQGFGSVDRTIRY